MTKSDDKRVPALRFKGFTDEWEQRKLGELVTMHARIGWQGLRKSEFITKGNFYILTGTDFKNGSIDFNKASFIGKERYDQDPHIQIKNKDILLTKDGTIGKVAYIDTLKKTATLNAGVYVIRPIYKSTINQKYLFHYLSTFRLLKYANQTATGGTIKHLNQKILVSFPIKTTSFIEEGRIADILDLINKLITLQQRKADDYFQYKTQLINTIFANKNWQIIKLRDVLSVPKEELANVTTKSQIMTVKLNLGGVINGANRDTLNLSATKYYIRHAGQFIFGKQNFFNGSMAIIPKAMDGKVTSQDVPALNINNEKINSKFLLYYLSRRNFYKHTERFATGTGSKRLHVDTLLNLKIRIPDISYQNQIVSTLTLLDKKLQLETAKLNKLKQLKHFLLQNMFI